MKKNHIIRTVVFLSGMITQSYGQNETDALRYSRTFLSGTARYVAMSGSFGGLGADFSNLSFNPAGVALYRKAELTFTPSIFARNTEAIYNGSALSDSKYNFSISNAGFVAASYDGDEKSEGWVGSGFAMGYNRLASFHQRTSIEGENNSSSFLDVFLNDVNKGNGTRVNDLDPFGAGLLWNTYLLNHLDTIDTMHYVSVIQKGVPLLQRKNIESSGSMGEYLFTIGGNYANRLMLGASFAVPVITFSETSAYQEIPGFDTLNSLNNYSFNQQVTTQGYGFNFKFGFIYRITDFFRFGGSVHTPTFFHLSDNYSSEAHSVFKNGDTYDSNANGQFSYELGTPLKFTASMGFIVGKSGLVNLDYEFLDYGEPRLRSSGYKFFDENKSIDSKYTEASNIRIGTEWMLEVFSIRGGAALLGSPFRKNISDASAISYSAGFGIREHGYFLDFGYSYTGLKEKYYLYDPSLVNSTDVRTYFHNFVVTLGYKF